MLRPRELFEEKFCCWRISSGHTEQGVQLRVFASYRSLELALLFSIYTNKLFKALNEKFGYVQLDGFSFRCFNSRERIRRSLLLQFALLFEYH